MPDYQKMYFLIFNAVTDGIAALNALNFGQTRDLLIRAQQQCEELYLDADTFSEGENKNR